MQVDTASRVAYPDTMAVYLSVEETMVRIPNASRQNIYDWLKSGHLEGIKDQRRMWLISEESIQTFQRPPMGRPRKRKKVLDE